MKKLLHIVMALLITVVLQSCIHTSENSRYIKHFEKLAKENPGSFIKHGYIGINVKLNLNGEIEITNVADDSSAGQEGIKPGDKIIEVDGIPIKNKYQVFKIYDSKYPGDSVTVVLKRRNELLTKHLNLSAFYTPTVFYVLYEKVYKDISIRLAIIPTPILLPSSLEKAREYFKNDTELKRYFEGGFLNIFRGHENFAVIDRQHIEKVLDEMKFQQSGLVKDESRIKIGQMLGATHLLLVNRSIELRGENEMVYSIWLDLIELESNKKIATSMMGSEKMNLGKDFFDYTKTSGIKNDLMANNIPSENIKPPEEGRQLAKEKRSLGMERKPVEEKRLSLGNNASVTTAKEIARDSRFIAYDNGTVLDTKTRLMWAEKDNDSGISWQEAKKYCENYRGGGYTDWRMPTHDELETLYDSRINGMHGCNLTRLIELTKCSPWALESSPGAYFRFDGGLREWTKRPFNFFSFRALPVRSSR